jgi:aldehyde:ferredoxin oxidoreductase
MHEPRGKVSVGLGYAVSPTGADHMEAPHDPDFEGIGSFHNYFGPLGLVEPVDRMDFGPQKVRAFLYTQSAWSLYNSVGLCDFVGIPIGDLKLEGLRDFVNAATGWNMSLFEMVKVGERANTMARLFNVREGFTAADDTLPSRLFEPLQNGALAGVALDRDAFDRALQFYYQMAGWDEHGVPTPAKLAELGLAIRDEK